MYFADFALRQDDRMIGPESSRGPQKQNPHTEKQVHPHTICPPTWGFYGGTGDNAQQQTKNTHTDTQHSHTLFRESRRSCPRTFFAQNPKISEATAASYPTTHFQGAIVAPSGATGWFLFYHLKNPIAKAIRENASNSSLLS